MTPRTIVALAAACVIVGGFGCAGLPTLGRDAADADAVARFDGDTPEAAVDGAPICDASAQTACASACVDLLTDPANCGACARRCDDQSLCADGVCQRACALGELFCSAACVNPRTDRTNCGNCGAMCAGTDVCAAGACRSTANGAPCRLSYDCGGTAVCLPAGFGWLDGYCTQPCSPASPCDRYSACATTATRTSCLRRCAERADCRAGYECLSIGAERVCAPACVGNPDVLCGPARCDTMTNACAGGCTRDDDCSIGSACDMIAARCVCTPSTRCGTGMTCYPATGRCGCNDDAVCGVGRTCDRTLGVCRGT